MPRTIKARIERGEQRVRTYISVEARHELKYLAALNKVTMEDMLDILLIYRCEYERMPPPDAPRMGIRHIDDIPLTGDWGDEVCKVREYKEEHRKSISNTSPNTGAGDNGGLGSPKKR